MGLHRNVIKPHRLDRPALTMKRVPLLFWLCCIFGPNQLGVNGCTSGCTCKMDRMTFEHAQLPADIPSNITQVFLTGFDFDTLSHSPFSGGGWKNIKVLDIHATVGEVLSQSFVGLEHLEHLGIHGDTLFEISDNTFDNLNNLITLDLSNNFHLHISQVIRSLYGSSKPKLVSLKNLLLTKLFSLTVQSVDLDEIFMTAISHGRRIEYLDISYMNINKLDFSSLHLLCKSLRHIKLQKTTLLFPKDFGQAPPCSSLRTVDITDMKMPITVNSLTFTNTNIRCSAMNVYNFMRTLYGGGILSTETIITNYHLDLTGCDFSLSTIYLKRNNAKILNMTVALSESIIQNLAYLDLSENIIEYINPACLLPSTNIKFLNLSSNRLNGMLDNFPSDFLKLLYAQSNLIEVYLADNQLSLIPHQFFRYNTLLEYIDLSKNRLTTISFDLKPLVNLKYIDLSKNTISLIDSDICLQLDNLHDLHDTSAEVYKKTNISRVILNSFKINLASNKFICTCQDWNLNFLKWIKTTDTVDRQNAELHCTLNGKLLDIQTTALLQLDDYCHQQRLILRLQIIIPIITFIILVITVIAIIVVYKKKQRHIYRHVLKQLKAGNYPKQFLVYLSYCSEDTDFTLINIYQKLNLAFSQLIGLDRSYVCIGDRNFKTGHYIPNEVNRCVQDAAVVMFVVSKTFCAKTFCQMEVNEAVTQQKPVLLLMKEFVDISDMPESLRRNFKRYTHASWVNDESGGHIQPDIQTLTESVIGLAGPSSLDIKSRVLHIVNCFRR